MANKKNLAIAELASGITSTATSATVKTGQGARLPSTPFYATLSPVGILSTPDNSEIISVTAVSTDTLTIVRAQKGTTAQSFVANSILANGIYAEDIPVTSDDIVDGTTNKQYSATDKTKLAGIATGADVTATQLPVATHAATSKTPPVDADEIPIADSAASFGLKKLTWANLKAAIQSFYDSAVSTMTNKTLTDPQISGSASAPSTPSTGFGKISGAGTGAVRPKWINSSGTLETIYTDKNNFNYSSSEVDTGKKWYDGRTIYSKVIDTTFSVAASGSNNVAHGISGLTGTCAFISAVGGINLGSTTSTTAQSLYYRETGGNWISLVSFNATNLVFASSFAWGTSRVIVQLEYVK